MDTESRTEHLRNEVIAALVLSAADLESPDGLSLDQGDLEHLVSELSDAVRSTTPPHQLASRVMSLASRCVVMRIDGMPARTTQLAAEAAVRLTDALLRARGFQIAPDRRAQVRAALLDSKLSRQARATTIKRAVIEKLPKPNLVILTPLSQLKSKAAQARLLQVADLVEEDPVTARFRIIVPGRSLSPDDSIVGSRNRRALTERRLILSATRVVVLLDGHDSWGAAKCVAWAESACIPVTVYTTRPELLSRVLAEDVPETRYVAYEDARQVAGDIVRTLEDDLATADAVVDGGGPGRTGDRSQVAAVGLGRGVAMARVGVPLHRLRTKLSGSSAPSMRPNLSARARAVSESPAESMTLTVAELIELSACEPGLVDEFLAAALNLEDRVREGRRTTDLDIMDASLDLNLLRFVCTDMDVNTGELLDVLTTLRDDGRVPAGHMRGGKGRTYLEGLVRRVRSRPRKDRTAAPSRGRRR